MKTGRKVVVTGASGGIGLATARRFAENGDSLFLHGFQNRGAFEELKRAYPAVSMETFFCDLSQRESQDELVDRAWNWGASSGQVGIDVLVEAAGVDILTGERKSWSYERKQEALWRVDVEAGIRIARETARRALESGQKGTILTVGWNATEWGMAGESAELFAMAKGAVTAFTRCLAQRVGPNIRVNCVAPGWIRTQWGANAPEAWQTQARRESLLDRWGTPEDMAQAFFFLASEEASFLNATVLPVDGGKRF